MASKLELVRKRASMRERLIVALDVDTLEQATGLVRLLGKEVGMFKIGKQLFTHAGPQAVRSIQELGGEVFLDLKFHDIPNTVAKACVAASRLGVWMLNVHAMCGRAMMEAAREAVDKAATPPKLIAVTVLTSMDQSALHEIGVAGVLQDQVLRLARLANSCKLDGVVCSAREAALLRTEIGKDFLLVTPGIRPADASLDDQSRVLTPAAALNQGASYLVVGRPITQAADPLLALQGIYSEIQDY